ncbi:MAG: SRPBCC family protein [Thermodesulfobacteriota bacterium]
MAEIEKSASIAIRRSCAEVFAFVADPANFPHWQPFVKEAAITSPGPIRTGATYRYTFEAMGQVVETTGVITEYQPCRRYAYRSLTGPFPIEGGFTFAEEEDGFVLVTAFGGADPGGYFPMARSIVGLLLGRTLLTTLRSLKELLESGRPPASG